MEPASKKAEIPPSKIYNITISDIPPWTIKTSEINLNPNKHHKKYAPLKLEKFEKIKESYPEHLCIFTDRSKYEKTAGYAAGYAAGKLKKKTPLKKFSIFNSEIWAIELALNFISGNKNLKKNVNFSEFQSIIIAINPQNSTIHH